MKTPRFLPIAFVRNALDTPLAGHAKRRILTVLTAFGLAGLASLQAQTFTPVPLTPSSFTVNVVIPVDWPYKLNNQSVTVTIDHGPCLQTDTATGFPTYYSIDSGDTFFEQGLNRPNPTYGLPAGGSLLTNATTTTIAPHIYQLPYWTNWNSNCICICPYTNVINNVAQTYNSQPLVGGPYTYPTNNPYYNPSLTLNNTNGAGGFNTNIFTALSFLSSSGGPDTNAVTIQYADGSTQGPVLFAIPNWFVNTNAYTYPVPSGSPQIAPTCSFAYTANCRCNPSENNNNYTLNSGVSSGSRLWSFDIALNNTNAAATNLIFTTGVTQGANGTTHSDVIIAVSGGANTADNATLPSTNILSGPFTPIPVSGFNAGFVVANSKQTLAGLAPLTATMDNGTNVGSGGNTWFEVGWDGAAPSNGFPAHASVLTSAVNPTRTYQMAANYHQNMCTLIDVNHKSVNITPQTPGTFTAFSLLTCGASIGAANIMTNYIILQHSDGVNESNIFFGYDWFNTTQPVAYTANERANVGSTSSTSGREVQNLDSGNPKIFESEFQMQDGSSVTNIQLGYLVAGGANWATYVIAVSGSTNFLPVQQVLAYTPAQNVFAGQSASFNVTPGIGSLPQFQWQYTDGLTFTNNLNNGASSVPGSSAIISGATTTNLTIANVGAADAGYLYTCQVYNSAPSSTNSPAAVLTLRVSTSPNITSPGDVITDFGETTLASPTGLGVANLIDGTLNAYLNYGPNASTAGPFAGPVGFIITPYKGSTVVNALVFYTAVNAPICDPADFMLEGSNDGGNTWATIVNDEPLALPVERNISTLFAVNPTNEVLQEVDFVNSTAYTTYRVTINNVRNDATANSMQIAEIQFLGVQQPVAPSILVQPSPASKTLLQGGTYQTTSVQASGPTNYYYQWYGIVGGVTNGVGNATNASLTMTGVALSQSGNYFCVVSNAYGAVTSSILSLTVIVPSSIYASTIVADGPIAYWRLDEGNGASPNPALPNGALAANDYMGGHDGIYTNAEIGVWPGFSTNDLDTAAEFGPNAAGGASVNSYVGQVPAFTNFVVASNSPAGFSVEAWVQNPAGNAQSIAGAGIVTYGYGGGGEQFALDCGGTGNNFRFYFRDAGSTSHPVSAPASGTGDGLWHHVVGVLNSQNASNNADYIYVDGALVGTIQLGTNLLGVRAGGSPLTIGARASSSAALGTNVYDLQFNGNIDEVAIYPYALSSNQVLAHYYASGIAPAFTLQPTNVIVSQNASATLATAVIGSPTLSLQWYIIPASTGNATLLANQTNAVLVLNDVQPDPSGVDSYYLVASNSYGVIQSTTVQLTVVSQPVFVQDLQPNYSFLAGTPFSLATVVRGTAPLTFGWYFDTSTVIQNGGRASGAHSNVLTIANAQLTDSGTYQIFSTNSSGTTPSQLATVTVVPTLGFNGFGGSWAVNAFDSAGNPFTYGYVGSNVLQFTDGAIDESSSSFFQYPVYIGGFQSSWTYQDVNGAGADGIAFVIHNDPRGAAALGGGGGSLGVSGITPSLELEFNIYAGNSEGVGYAFSSGGVVASTFIDPFPLEPGFNIASGNPIYVNLNYLNGMATLTLTETNDAGGNYTYETSMAINLPSIVGGTSAYVGFTGADGGTAAVQQISDFNFVSLPPLAVESTAPGTFLFSWPAGVGGYVLQQTASLNSPNWTTVSGTVTQAGGLNQQTVTSTVGQMFYRLYVPYTPQ